MVIHFDTETKAIDHLRKSDFRKLKNGYWLSPSRDVKASIHPAYDAVVRVMFQAAA